jgi:hypothetical protein
MFADTRESDWSYCGVFQARQAIRRLSWIGGREMNRGRTGTDHGGLPNQRRGARGSNGVGGNGISRRRTAELASPNGNLQERRVPDYSCATIQARVEWLLHLTRFERSSAMTSNPVPVDDRNMRMLTDELAHQVLSEVAPEELVLYAETAREYYADPRALLDPKRRDEALGFGLDLAMITPVVIVVAQSVLQWLANTVVDAAAKEASSSVEPYLRRFFRRAGGKPATRPAALTADQAKRVWAVAYKQALAVGLAPDRASLIADSTAGALLTAG